ncbi:MAG: hypothetical protein QMC33_05085, partial [Octadecabacter sp.]
MPDLLREALIENGVPDDLIQVIPDEVEAVDAALKMGQTDDLVLLFGDNIARTRKQVIYYNRPQGEPEADDKTASMAPVAEP